MAGEMLADARTGKNGRHALVQVAISAVLLCASVYVILAPAYGPKDKHWAYGMVGTIVGFWFK